MSDSHPPSPWPADIDSQLPSTSGHSWEDHDCSPFGNLPLTSTIPSAEYFVVPALPSSRESEIGGRAMHRMLAHRNIAEWNPSYQQPGGMNRWDSRASLNSVASACSIMSNMSAVSGLSIRTDITAYSERDLIHMNESLYHNRDVKENRRPALSNSSTTEESDGETRARNDIEKHFQGENKYELFLLCADRPDLRDYRKMMIRIFSKEFVGMAENKMTLLGYFAVKYRDALAKILCQIFDDIGKQSGKIRLDALTSLSECKVAIDTSRSQLVSDYIAAFGLDEHLRDKYIEMRMDTLFRAINVPDMDEEKRDAYEADCSISAIKLLYNLMGNHHIKKVCKRKLEWAKRLMRIMILERDLEPKRKHMCMDLLRRFVSKKNMLEMDGITQYLNFLNKHLDYSLAEPGTATGYYLLRVQKTEDLLATAVRQLHALVTIPVGSRRTDMESIAACKDRIVREGGIQILASWLDHGSNRVIYAIGECLRHLARVPAVAQQNLGGAIRRAVQLLGNNHQLFVDSLLSFVINVASVSERHRTDLIAASGFRAFIHMIATWTEALAVEREKHETSAMIRLHKLSQALLDLTPDCEKRETPAIDQLLAEPRTLPALLRLLSFDFAYVDNCGGVSSASEPHLTGRKRGAAEGSDERSAKYTMAPVARSSVQESNDERLARHFALFWKHDRGRQAFELTIKANAARLLNRLAASQLRRQRAGEALGKGLNVSQALDPLWKESLPIMLLRRLNDLAAVTGEYALQEHAWHDARRNQCRYVVPHQKAQDKTYMELTTFVQDYIVNATDAISDLLRTLHGDRECFQQIKGYLAASGESKPRLNPISQLIRLKPQGFSRVEALFAGRILTYLDAFLTDFIAEGGGLKSSLHAWVANETLRRIFWDALEITRKECMIQDDDGVYRRLTAHLPPPLSQPPAQYRGPVRR